MATSKQNTKVENDLAKNVKELAKEIKRIKKQDFYKYFTNTPKFLLFSFVNGLLKGLGALIGATIFGALFFYLLSKAMLIPILGDFVSDIIDEVNSNLPINNNH